MIYLKFYIVLFVIAVALLAVGCSSTTQYGVDKTVDVAKDAVDTSDSQQELAQSLPSDAVFTLDTENSVMGWHASKIVSNDHTGTIQLSSGTLFVENDEFTSGNFVVDMTTIADNDGSENLVNHLKNEDFFNVEMYPTSTFVLSSMTESSDTQFIVTGDLTILDSTNEISFPATLAYDDATQSLSAQAEFTIDRTKWGIEYGSGSVFKDLGDKAIKDEIDFELDLVFN